MPVLSLESIRKSFWRGPSESTVLKDVSLEVEAGELVAVYGQRNSGKSTLLRIAAGFDRPDAGAVALEGTILAALGRRELAAVHRHRIGWVERGGPHEAAMPLQLHVGLPLYRSLGPSEARRRASEVLAEVGLAECGDRRWADLSDTDRILVAIAQAMVREPRLLVVDDPTAGLGILERERVVGLLRTVAEERGVGVLMAVPDMPAMLHAHHVRSLSRGRLVAPAQAGPDDGGGELLDFPAPRRTA